MVNKTESNVLHNCNFYVKCTLDYIQKNFISEWKSDLMDDRVRKTHGNRLRCYRTFKLDFKMESYIMECSNFFNRKYIAMMRLSAHNLFIETGRFSNPRILPEQRICKHCNLCQVEDEMHFILQCSKYNDIRRAFFNQVSDLLCSDFIDMTEEQKLIYLFCHNDKIVINKLGSYIGDCLHQRSKCT